MSTNLENTKNSPALPRPTQSALEPVGGKDFLGSIGLALGALIGFGLGLGGWLNADIAEALLQDYGSGTNYVSPWWLMLAFPILLPGAIYLGYDGWRRWQNSRILERSKKISTAVITHLWVDPPRPPGKHYYVGYRFGSGHTACQKVHARTYKTLAVGDELTVEYAADNPALSRLDLQRRPKKKKTITRTNS